jgi:protein-disulfide isomerase
MQSRHRHLVVLAAVLVPLGFTATVMAFRGGSTPALLQAQTAATAEVLPADLEKQFADAWAQQPVVDFRIPKGTAKVVIVKFNDWLCGACRGWHEAYQPLLDKYEKESPGSIKLVLKDWPWNSRCNFRTPQTLPGHEASCEAAVAVRLARERGKEHDLETWLWAEQSRLIDMRLKGGTPAADAIKAKATALLMLKPGEFDREQAARLPAIRQDVSDGAALNVDSTPIYYVNGIKTTQPYRDGSGGNLPPVYFDAAIRLELKKAAK